MYKPAISIRFRPEFEVPEHTEGYVRGFVPVKAPNMTLPKAVICTEVSSVRSSYEPVTFGRVDILNNLVHVPILHAKATDFAMVMMHV